MPTICVSPGVARHLSASDPSCPAGRIEVVARLHAGPIVGGFMYIGGGALVLILLIVVVVLLMRRA